MLKNMIKKRVELISETILCMFLLEKILEKSVEEIVRRTSRGWLKLCFTGTFDSNISMNFAIFRRNFDELLGRKRKKNLVGISQKYSGDDKLS